MTANCTEKTLVKDSMPVGRKRIVGDTVVSVQVGALYTGWSFFGK